MLNDFFKENKIIDLHNGTYEVFSQEDAKAGGSMSNCPVQETG